MNVHIYAQLRAAGRDQKQATRRAVLIPDWSQWATTADLAPLTMDLRRLALGQSRRQDRLLRPQHQMIRWVGGQCHWKSWDDPVAYVYANITLSEEARHWIEGGDLQQRYPELEVREGQLCVDGETGNPAQLHNFPLSDWIPLDPGRHEVVATLFTRSGSTTDSVPYDVEIHLLLTGAE